GVVSGGTARLSATGGGEYIVSVSSANGCIASDTAVVTENKVLPAVTVAGGELTCDITSIDLTATGSADVQSYSWSGPGGVSGAKVGRAAWREGEESCTVTAAKGRKRG